MDNASAKLESGIVTICHLFEGRLDNALDI